MIALAVASYAFPPLHLRAGPTTLRHVHMTQPEQSTSLGVANGELLDCIAAAEGGAEIEECELAYDAAFDDGTQNGQPATSKAEQQPASTAPDASVPDEQRQQMVSATGALLDCIAEAEGGAEIEECELAYDAALGNYRLEIIDAP